MRTATIMARRSKFWISRVVIRAVRNGRVASRPTVGAIYLFANNLVCPMYLSKCLTVAAVLRRKQRLYQCAIMRARPPKGLQSAPLRHPRFGR